MVNDSAIEVRQAAAKADLTLKQNNQIWLYILEENLLMKIGAFTELKAHIDSQQVFLQHSNFVLETF